MSLATQHKVHWYDEERSKRFRTIIIAVCGYAYMQWFPGRPVITHDFTQVTCKRCLSGKRRRSIYDGAA